MSEAFGERATRNDTTHRKPPPENVKPRLPVLRALESRSGSALSMALTEGLLKSTDAHADESLRLDIECLCRSSGRHTGRRNLSHHLMT